MIMTKCAIQSHKKTLFPEPILAHYKLYHPEVYRKFYDSNGKIRRLK